MKEAATHINTMLSKQESAVRLMNIQNAFLGKVNLMKDNTREFLLEGRLRKFNRTNNDVVDRTFFLFSDRLLYGTQVGSGENPRYKNHKIYDVRLLTAKQLPANESHGEEKFCFQVTYVNEQLILAARNQAMRHRWVAAINSAAEENQKKNDELQKRRTRGTFGKGKLAMML